MEPHIPANPNEEIVRRLRHIMTLRRYNQRSLAALLRIDPANLSRVLTGKANFTDGLVNRIVVDLGISKRWLTTGEGVPFDKGSAPREIHLDTPLVPAPLTSGTPVYDLDVTAGRRPLEQLFGEVRPVGMIDIPGMDTDSRIVRVRGDSMQPRISNGAYVAIHQVFNLDTIFWGNIYVVQLDDYRLVKYVRRHDDPGRVILHSENPRYDDMDIPRTAIRSLYYVDTILNLETQ